jgi:hypothetical protein
VSPASIALTVVRRLRSTKEYEENFKVTAEQPIINKKHWPRTMEAIREFFGSVLGETGVPLAYVVCKNVEIPPGTDPSEGYITVAEEMIARAPHGNQAYANDSVGSRTWDRSKVKPGLVRKDIRSSGSDNLQQGKEDVFTNSDQPRGKTKKSSLLHLTSTE